MKDVLFKEFAERMEATWVKEGVPQKDRNRLSRRLWRAAQWARHLNNLERELGQTPDIRKLIENRERAVSACQRLIRELNVATDAANAAMGERKEKYIDLDALPSLPGGASVPIEDNDASEDWRDDAVRFKRQTEEFRRQNQECADGLLTLIPTPFLTDAERKRLEELGDLWPVERFTKILHQMWLQMDDALKSDIKNNAAKRDRIIAAASRVIGHAITTDAIKRAIQRKRKQKASN